MTFLLMETSLFLQLDYDYDVVDDDDDADDADVADDADDEDDE